MPNEDKQIRNWHLIWKINFIMAIDGKLCKTARESTKLFAAFPRNAGNKKMLRKFEF